MRAGFWEILLIVVLVLILFGHNKIPTLMKNLANGINIFKKEIKETKDSASAAVQQGAASAKRRVNKSAATKKSAPKSAQVSAKKSAPKPASKRAPRKSK